MRSRRVALLVSASFLTVGVANAQATSGTASPSGTPAPPTGDQQLSPAPDTAQPTHDTTSTNGLGDIIVTATRRAEAAQSIPIAITAVSSATLKTAAISNLQNLTKQIVGVQYDSASPQRPELAIRGIYTDRFDIGADPSSGVYIDEIYQARFADVLNGLVDVDRVEVLRGPQGTLFGRNNIGGAISVFTADPGKDLGGYISGTYGNKNYVDVNGAVTVPISDSIQGRFAGGFSDRDGFMRDTVTGRTNGNRSFTGRGKIVDELSDTLSLKIEGAYHGSTQKAVLGDPISTPLILQGPQKGYTLDGNPFSGAYTDPGRNKLETGSASARLDWKPDAFAITALASWIGFNQTIHEDEDAAVNNTLFYNGHERSNTYSAEVRLASQPGGVATFDGRLKWLAGVYVFKDKGTEHTDLVFGPDSIFGFLAAPSGSESATERLDVHSTLNSIAGYFQLTGNITDKLDLTVGGRYTHDRRPFTFNGTQIGPADFYQVIKPYSVHEAPSAASFDPKAVLEYHFTPSVLSYFSFSRGFKSGAIQATANNAEQASVVTKPEHVSAYELGLKSEFFQHRLRLNIAAFYNNFADLQVRRVVTFPDGTNTAVAENAATATIKGVEAEASALIAPGLRIDASYAYLHGRYGKYIVDANTNYDGFTLPRAPTNRVDVAGSYTKDLAGKGSVSGRVAYNYTSGYFLQPDNLQVERQKGYGLLDASLSYTLANGTSSVQIWGRNLGNKTYISYLDPFSPEYVAFYGDRRTFGFTLNQKF